VLAGAIRFFSQRVEDAHDGIGDVPEDEVTDGGLDYSPTGCNRQGKWE
jgi:hypothetical protein